MMTEDQIRSTITEHAPILYFESKEKYLPSSVDWFLERATLAWKDGRSIEHPAAAQLPKVGSDDGSAWLTLPEQHRGGDLSTARALVHCKLYADQTYTDLQFWSFYPFNGPGTIEFFTKLIEVSPIGEHTGDWEHFTLRVDNATGKPVKAYLSEHDSGKWIVADELEEHNGRKALYSSRNGHATYRDQGSNISDSFVIGGLANITDNQGQSLDTSKMYSIIAADIINGKTPAGLPDWAPQEPDWLDYPHRWGPHLQHDVPSSLEKIIHLLPENVKDVLTNENGPTTPKHKSSWYGDE